MLDIRGGLVIGEFGKISVEPIGIWSHSTYNLINELKMEGRSYRSK